MGGILEGWRCIKMGIAKELLMPLEQHVTHHQVTGGYDNAADHQWEANPVERKEKNDR